MTEERPERLDEIVRDLLKGRRLRLRASDSDHRDAILAAARLAGARQPYPRMTHAFRKRLQQMLALEPVRAVSRRTALVAGLAAAAGALGGLELGKLGQLASAPEPLRNRPPPSGGRVVIDPLPGRWTDVAGTSDLVEGQPLRVSVGSLFSVFLIRHGDRVSALSTICTHQPCELVAAGGRLNCPCHNAAFDLMGASLSATYPLPPLAQARVRIVEGRVQVMGS